MVSDTREPITAPLDEGMPVPEPPNDASSPAASERIPLAIFWFVVVAALLLFIAFGTVVLHYSGAHPKITSPAHERIIRVWLDQADRLPRAASDTLIRVLYFLALAIILVGTAVALWLALIARSESEAAEAVAPAWDQIERSTTPPASDVAGDRE